MKNFKKSLILWYMITLKCLVSVHLLKYGCRHKWTMLLQTAHETSFKTFKTETYTAVVLCDASGRSFRRRENSAWAPHLDLVEHFLTLISLREVSASTVRDVSPLPLREDVPPKDVRVPAVKAEAARDPCAVKKRTFHEVFCISHGDKDQQIRSPSPDNLCPPPVDTLKYS